MFKVRKVLQNKGKNKNTNSFKRLQVPPYCYYDFEIDLRSMSLAKCLLVAYFPHL